MISKPLFQIEVLFVINIQHENFSHLFKNPAVFVDVLLPLRNSDDCRRFFVKAHRDVRSRQRPRIFCGGVYRNFVQIFRYDFPRRRTPAAFYTIAAKTTCKTTVCACLKVFSTPQKRVRTASPLNLSAPVLFTCLDTAASL